MARTSRPGRGSPGFTMAELMVSLVVFGIIMTISLSFLQTQTRGYRLGLERMSVLQTLRFAMGTLEQDIQTAGTHTASGQPELVYAGASIIAFNADYVTRQANDPFAVFYDPDVEALAAISVPSTRKFTLPGTSFAYPDTTYWIGGGERSRAETIILFFQADTSTSRTDDYILYRQVNDDAPQPVAENLLAVSGEPFFRYFWEGTSALDSISGDSLPFSHGIRLHGSAADTGRAARIDSIRAVRLTLAATNGKEGEAERTALLTRMIRMPNVGFGTLQTCGSRPILGSSLSASLIYVDGAPAVNLTWPRSTDEGGGEGDVVRYVLYRRAQGSTDWGEPYLSIPAGENSYTYQDANVTPGDSLQYALAAQDCTPTLSPLSSAVAMTIPTT